jgi:hypothetical protein
MLRSVFQAMESGVLAEVSLLVFVFVFALVIFRVFTLSKKDVETGKYMPLEEPTEHYPDEESTHQREKWQSTID